jgi:hypothetical protein
MSSIVTGHKSKRLISEKGFRALAVEADWPDVYRVNFFVRLRGDGTEAIDALAGFTISDLDVAQRRRPGYTRRAKCIRIS